MKFLSDCNKKCGEKYGHDGECICKQPHSHPCYKQCFFYGKSDGCNTECNKQYGHEGNCMCSVNRENHTCKIECQLYTLCGKKCSGKCGHIFGHENNENNDLKCQKCNNDICILTLDFFFLSALYNSFEFNKIFFYIRFLYSFFFRFFSFLINKIIFFI